MPRSSWSPSVWWHMQRGPKPNNMCWGIYHLSLYSSVGRLYGRVITLRSVLARLTLSSGLVYNPHHAVLAGDHLVAMSVYWSILSVYICELKYSHSAKGQVHAVVRCYTTHFLYNNNIIITWFSVILDNDSLHCSGQFALPVSWLVEEAGWQQWWNKGGNSISSTCFHQVIHNLPGGVCMLLK